MNIYNFLLRKNDYDTEDYAYLLFYYPNEVNSKGVVVFHTKLLKIKIDVKKAKNLFKDALKCLEGRIPKCSDECEYCSYIKNNE